LANKSKFWRKVKILAKKSNFLPKIKILVKSKIFGKSKKSDPKYKLCLVVELWSKVKILGKNGGFCQRP